MMNQPGIVPSPVEIELLRDTHGFSPTDNMELPIANSMILSPPPEKVGIYFKTFDVGLRLPLTDFQDELLQKNRCSIKMLTLNAVNKMVAFKMFCWANNILPNSFVFKFFFWSSATRDNFMFSTDRGGHVLVPNSKNPKKWQDKWLWVNRERVSYGHYRANEMSNFTHKLFPHNQVTDEILKTFQFVTDEYSKAVLSGVGMSPSWRARGKMLIFYVVMDGFETPVSIDSVL
ncbi:unnamed protein product [Lactuca saligna]|uniref:Uncharacterized protein n=1 Tax=Lactuca saligna TaxID=75948 RepID=A0AA36E159_LACSI|nr:unnamed protein product [Lactuca saligna]